MAYLHVATGSQMAQLVCTNAQCTVVLMYPRGANQVQCSVCGHVNDAMAVRMSVCAPVTLQTPSSKLRLLWVLSLVSLRLTHSFCHRYCCIFGLLCSTFHVDVLICLCMSCEACQDNAGSQGYVSVQAIVWASLSPLLETRHHVLSCASQHLLHCRRIRSAISSVAVATSPSCMLGAPSLSSVPAATMSRLSMPAPSPHLPRRRQTWPAMLHRPQLPAIQQHLARLCMQSTWRTLHQLISTAMRYVAHSLIGRSVPCCRDRPESYGMADSLSGFELSFELPVLVSNVWSVPCLLITPASQHLEREPTSTPLLSTAHRKQGLCLM